jgi:hypothetical protein
LIFAEFGSGQVLWSVLWIFMFVIWFWLLVTIFGDLFRDPDESGWAKAAWIVFVLVLPFLGILVYLIVRGHGMQERAIDAVKAQQAAMDEYVRTTAGAGDATDQIAKAKSLLDGGAITQAEFDDIKRKALS